MENAFYSSKSLSWHFHSQTPEMGTSSSKTLENPDDQLNNSDGNEKHPNLSLQRDILLVHK